MGLPRFGGQVKHAPGWPSRHVPTPRALGRQRRVKGPSYRWQCGLPFPPGTRYSKSATRPRISRYAICWYLLPKLSDPPNEASMFHLLSKSLNTSAVHSSSKNTPENVPLYPAAIERPWTRLAPVRPQLSRPTAPRDVSTAIRLWSIAAESAGETKRRPSSLASHAGCGPRRGGDWHMSRSLGRVGNGRPYKYLVNLYPAYPVATLRVSPAGAGGGPCPL